MSETSSAYQDASRDHEPSIGSALEGRERPMLFSAPMVRALLAGTKTQTRRVVKPQPADSMIYRGRFRENQHGWSQEEQDMPTVWACRYGQPGDLLWVRESGIRTRAPGGDIFRHDVPETPEQGRYWAESLRGPGAAYSVAGCSRGAALAGVASKACPSIHMPRWASRITLRVTDVRAERLNDISFEDCWAEGVICDIHGAKKHTCCSGLTRGYQTVWEHINGPGSWAANPWVWCVSFERLVPQVEGSWSREELNSGERTS